MKELSMKEAAIILGIRTKSRQTEIVLKRYAFWMLLRKKKVPYSEIGKATGGQKHCSVMYGIKIAKDPFQKRYIEPYLEEVQEVVNQIDFKRWKRNHELLKKVKRDAKAKENKLSDLLKKHRRA